jgi:glycosyltransferase involved in cell wall biosynthesis
MKTVVHLISTLADCGPVNVLWGIVRNLDRQEYRRVIVTLSPEPTKSSLERFRNDGTEVHQLNLSRVHSLVYGRKRVREAMTVLGADIIQCHGIRATLLAAGKCAHTPTIATLHCDLASDYRLAYGAVLGRIMSSLEYRALRKYSAVVAVSANVRDSARRHGIDAVVIENGIDLEHYSHPKDKAEIVRLRKLFGWPLDSVVILHTGALTPRKRPIEVIRAFLNLRTSNRQFLVLAGDGPLKNESVEAAKGSDSISFLGRRNDIPNLLKASNVLISNSTTEGLPLALLEGLATGITILATDILPHRKIYEMFPDQVVLFKDALERSLVELVSRFGDDCFARSNPSAAALESISDARMARSYEQTYRSLLSVSLA